MRKVENESKWFLIDWEDADTPPTLAQPSFNKTIHSPAIFRDGHGPEVDIWAIGYLIRTTSAQDVSQRLFELGQRVCRESDVLKAEDVIALIMAT